MAAIIEQSVKSKIADADRQIEEANQKLEEARRQLADARQKSLEAEHQFTEAERQGKEAERLIANARQTKAAALAESQGAASEPRPAFKKVFIQDLKPKDDRKVVYTSSDDNEYIDTLTRKCVAGESQYSCDRELFYESRIYSLTKSDNNRIYSGLPDNFISAYLYDYNNHKDIIMSVNDLWSQITLMTSNYINDNAEALRSRIVSHQGKIKLQIKEFADSEEESLKMEREWNYFFSQIIDLIKVNTSAETDICGALENNFSVCTYTHHLLTVSATMNACQAFFEYSNACQAFFEYSRMICCCGIPNVYLEGTLEDWVLLKEKILELAKFAVSDDPKDKLNEYIMRLVIIVDKLIDTYNDKVDLDFWNNIMTTNEVRVGSGGDKITYLEGWITHFSQIYTRVDIDQIKNHRISVPVELINSVVQPNTKKDLTLYGSFTGVSHNAELNAFRPHLTIALYHHLTAEELKQIADERERERQIRLDQMKKDRGQCNLFNQIKKDREQRNIFSAGMGKSGKY